MLSIRKRIKRTKSHYSLRKKINALKQTRGNKIKVCYEDAQPKNDFLNVIIFPNKA